MKKTKEKEKISQTPLDYNGHLASYTGFAFDAVNSALDGLKTTNANINAEMEVARAKIKELEAHCIELKATQTQTLDAIDKLDEFLKAFKDKTE